MNVTKVSQFETDLCEFMWRWWDRRQKPEAIQNLIKVYYTFGGPPQFSAIHPLFRMWKQRPTDTLNDTLSHNESSADNDSDTEDIAHHQQPAASAGNTSTETTQQHQQASTGYM